MCKYANVPMKENATVVSLSSLRPLCEILTAEIPEEFAEKKEKCDECANMLKDLHPEPTLNFEP